MLSYLRKNPQSGDSILVVLNMSDQRKTLVFDMTQGGISGRSAQTLISNPFRSTAAVPLNALPAAPFGNLRR